MAWPVETWLWPVPSRASSTTTLVSLVSRVRVALRSGGWAIFDMGFKDTSLKRRNQGASSRRAWTRASVCSGLPTLIRRKAPE